MKKITPLFKMKFSTKLFLVLITFLPSILFAQTRSIDLQAVMTQPPNGDTIVAGQSFSYHLYIKNNGPDTVQSFDTLYAEFSGSGGIIEYTNALIPPGDSIEILNSNASVSNTGSGTLCLETHMVENNVTDPDSLNNTVCDTVFFVNPTDVAAIQGGSVLFKIYPNPATSFVILTCMSEEESDMNVRIIDISGREVLRHNYGKMQQGKNDLKLDSF